MTFTGRAFQSQTAVGMNENLNMSLEEWVVRDWYLDGWQFLRRSGVCHGFQELRLINCNEVMRDLVHHGLDGCFSSGLE